MTTTEYIAAATLIYLTTSTTLGWLIGTTIHTMRNR
jgi:hypothetical protein